MIEALGLSGPDLFLTLAKLFAGLGIIFFLADQFLGGEKEWDD